MALTAPATESRERNRPLVTLKLRTDRWDDDRSVLPFLKSIATEQVGPDGALLLFSVELVKRGRREPYVVTEWQLELETKVRSLDVARWAIERMAEVSDVDAAADAKDGLDEIGLALRIADATKRLDRGTTSDAPQGDQDDEE